MATKIKTTFYCQSCGVQSPKWVGKCGSCNQWNTYVEEVVTKPQSQHLPHTTEENQRPILLDDVNQHSEQRLPVFDNELARVLGGGIVAGSVILVGGEPGIGKSTLMLQLAIGLDQQKVLYISGEESSQQIKLRAGRLGSKNSQCYLYSGTLTSSIFTHAQHVKPDLLIVDSIQTLHTPVIDSSPGSVSQIRECTAELIKFAKQSGIPVFLIGHITKDGAIAGPKVLEHMVDTVLQFEGDRNNVFRILRTTKNRFGSTNELGVYEMGNSGLKEVPNPSTILLSSREEELSGVGIAATMEGMRPILIETQALVSTAAYGTPQRTCTGFDTKRLNMLLAVLEKRCGFNLAAKDVFLNIAGGLKVSDPAIDLAVVCAVLSSAEDIPIPKGCCFAAEVGLSGELRPVSRIEQRITEAEKMGFDRVFISSLNGKGLTLRSAKIKLIETTKVQLVFEELFG